jgi:Leucine-rich repeat (LRR) protein
MNLVFPNLIEFLVGENQIIGNFPASISNLTELQERIILMGQYLLLTLGQLKKLEYFHIGTNNFGSGRAHDLNFISSLINCTQLSILIFSGNRFGGELPDHIGNFSTHLSWFELGHNQIYGVIPKKIGQLIIGLKYLSIGNNFLEGIIPDSIGKLNSLVKLNLQKNKLFGNIPSSIDNKLQGSIPITLRYCTHLLELNIAYNKLSGDIPNEIFSCLDDLIYIFMGKNFLTGPIPSEFGKLKHLSILFLDTNKLSGEIPEDLASCA